MGEQLILRLLDFIRVFETFSEPHAEPETETQPESQSETKPVTEPEERSGQSVRVSRSL